jgi:hypothetical protein
VLALRYLETKVRDIRSGVQSIRTDCETHEQDHTAPTAGQFLVVSAITAQFLCTNVCSLPAAGHCIHITGRHTAVRILCLIRL